MCYGDLVVILSFSSLTFWMKEKGWPLDVSFITFPLFADVVWSLVLPLTLFELIVCNNLPPFARIGGRFYCFMIGAVACFIHLMHWLVLN